jgi:hypothetical protein
MFARKIAHFDTFFGNRSAKKRHLVDTWRIGLLQTEEARPQNIDGEMMQERRQFILSVPGDGFSYAGLRL